MKTKGLLDVETFIRKKIRVHVSEDSEIYTFKIKSLIAHFGAKMVSGCTLVSNSICKSQPVKPKSNCKSVLVHINF